MRRHSAPAESVQGSVSGFAASMQVKPASSTHIAEQPSPETALPSSHASPMSTLPSPQTEAHACVPVASRHAGSFVHVFEQPRAASIASPVKRPFTLPVVASLPSSHDSPASTTPLPQTEAVQTEGEPVQDQPGSERQVVEHPIPGAGGSQF